MLSGQAAAQNGIWSIGPKIGYTFGAEGGVTAGFEVSYFPNYDALPIGYTCDITVLGDPSRLSLHLGAEAYLIAGLDIGPTLFLDRGRFYPGVSIIPFVGVGLLPYYEFGVPFDHPPFESVGGYLKFPIGSGGYGHGFSVG
ncbi:MAG: hypothetical protein Q8922_08360 [Bacteroidota bacterium]|nr:hypothetical protein [Bacteroidota bacterium]MDP4233499.1 hypothetical protein [Bacteroidota bacterium]MDP4243376.1 hypothetical protein [Bacteroidota bacterium]MDP4287937.1 hypothetical protein [Bacteroidota bacterium]